MILQALVKYYEMMAAEDKLPKQGYCTGKVSYALELSGEGELCGITTLRLPVEHGKKKGDAAQLLEVPEQESRSVNILPFFLCDNAIYLLGLDTKGNPKRALQCFEASKKTAPGNSIRRRSSCRARNSCLFRPLGSGCGC